MLFLDIFASSVAPIFVLMGIGVLIDRLFTLDIPTLTKISFYVFSPVLLFSIVYDSQLKGSQMLDIAFYVLVYAAAVFALGLVVFSLPPFRPNRTLMLLGIVFTNTGIYGIPVMLLAFGQEAAEIQAIILVTQSLLVFTLGVILINSHQASLKESVIQFLKYPMVYALLLAVIMRALHVPIPGAIRVPIDEITGGFVAVALITLGAELSRSQIVGDVLPVGVISLMRLVIAPLLAAGLLLFVFDFEPEVERVLFVAGGLPVAVNVYVLAAQFNREPAIASRMVFWTTLLSGLTIPVLLFFANRG